MRFGVAQDLPDGLLTRFLVGPVAIVVVAAAAAVATVVLVRKRAAARRRFPPQAWSAPTIP